MSQASAFSIDEEAPPEQAGRSEAQQPQIETFANDENVGARRKLPARSICSLAT